VTMERATLGGGCFWCLEAVYEQVEGVVRTGSGYAGGQMESPTYEAVCSGTTGHAEVVQVEFDTTSITYTDILEIFFGIHDPTTIDRQGNDVGPQYRSAIFTEDEAQAVGATRLVTRLTDEAVFAAPIVTQVQPLERFWPAGADHDDYFRRNPQQPYCMMVVGPKVAKFRQRFSHRLRT
jgi:peptide-methionine (S)-S-oxide reductase